MRKSDLRERLDEALSLLGRTLDEPRIRVPICEEIRAFQKRVQEEREAVASGSGMVNWRLATLTNPQTGNKVTLELKKDGSLSPSDQERTGLERAEEWTEVRALSRVEALEKIEAGEGTRHEWEG